MCAAECAAAPQAEPRLNQKQRAAPHTATNDTHTHNNTIQTTPQQKQNKTKQNKTKVHKARLDDGREVAVKVQYPGLKAAADADLAVLSFVNALAAKAFPQFNLGWLYKELWRKLREELGAPLRLR